MKALQDNIIVDRDKNNSLIPYIRKLQHINNLQNA